MARMIDEQVVRRVAHLARLRLTDEEVRQFAEQLDRILEYARQLEQVDTDGVEPLAHPLPATNVLRDDEPQPCLAPEIALANAPQRHDDYFRVPAVLDPGASA